MAWWYWESSSIFIQSSTLFNPQRASRRNGIIIYYFCKYKKLSKQSLSRCDAGRQFISSWDRQVLDCVSLANRIGRCIRMANPLSYFFVNQLFCHIFNYRNLINKSNGNICQYTMKKLCLGLFSSQRKDDCQFVTATWQPGRPVALWRNKCTEKAADAATLVSFPSFRYIGNIMFLKMYILWTTAFDQWQDGICPALANLHFVSGCCGQDTGCLTQTTIPQTRVILRRAVQNSYATWSDNHRNGGFPH